MCTVFDLLQLIAALLLVMLFYLMLLPQIEYVLNFLEIASEKLRPKVGRLVYLVGSISEKLKRRGK